MHFCRIFRSVDLRAFSPLPALDYPADFHLRPAPLEKAPPRTSLVYTPKLIPAEGPDLNWPDVHWGPTAEGRVDPSIHKIPRKYLVVDKKCS